MAVFRDSAVLNIHMYRSDASLNGSTNRCCSNDMPPGRPKKLAGPSTNPHAWRKFKQAERNMIQSFYQHRRIRSGRKWARQMKRWIERLFGP
jgi:hypothetical protein